MIHPEDYDSPKDELLAILEAFKEYHRMGLLRQYLERAISLVDQIHGKGDENEEKR